MSSSSTPSAESPRDRQEVFEELRRTPVFIRWCLQREALRWWSFVVLLFPVLVTGYLSTRELTRFSSGQGSRLLQTLFWASAGFICFGAVNHASGAVCWEMSRELRDLIRLTGISPKSLLWWKSVGRWWTIGFSILLILPLAMFARTLGGTGFHQWFAGICWLIALMVLVAGFAMFASVSSTHANNPETTAATSTFLLIVLYHLSFLAVCLVIGISRWLTHGEWNIPNGSWEQRVMQFALSLTPIAGLYSGFSNSSTFSPLEVRYWIHFVTGWLCLKGASIAICNRLAVTTRGDEEVQDHSASQPITRFSHALRPRCSDHPFFWKDRYILGGGRKSESWWTAISVLALMGVIFGIIYGYFLLVGMITICVCPCLLAIRFDGLLAQEFRDKTWSGLMLLPVDPRLILVEKYRAVIWERRALALPLCVAGMSAVFSNPSVALIAMTIASIAGVLMVEISIINHFYSKIRWTGVVIGPLLAVTITSLAVLWAYFDAATSFTITVIALISLVACFYLVINWRLRNWIDD